MEHIAVSEEKSENIVNLLVEMLKACDGETINYILKESGQDEYAFESILRSKEVLREHVGCLDNVVDMYSRLQLMKEDIDGIEAWAKDNCIDIQNAVQHAYPLSRYLGNLSEISDMDNDLGEWKAPYVVIYEPDRFIKMCDVVRVSPMEWVVNGVNFKDHDTAYKYANNPNRLVDEFFERVWVTVKGESKPLECNWQSLKKGD